MDVSPCVIGETRDVGPAHKKSPVTGTGRVRGWKPMMDYAVSRLLPLLYGRFGTGSPIIS
jgi:hypothetical protein